MPFSSINCNLWSNNFSVDPSNTTTKRIIFKNETLFQEKNGIQKALTHSKGTQRDPDPLHRTLNSYNNFQCRNCSDCGLKFHHIPRTRPSGTPFCNTLRHRAVGTGGLVWRKIAPVQRPQRIFLSSDL